MKQNKTSEQNFDCSFGMHERKENERKISH